MSFNRKELELAETELTEAQRILSRAKVGLKLAKLKVKAIKKETIIEETQLKPKPLSAAVPAFIREATPVPASDPGYMSNEEYEARWGHLQKKTGLLFDQMPTFLREQVEAELAVDEDKGPA